MKSVVEEWRGVKGHKSEYEVSNLGRVKSLSRNLTDKVGRLYVKPERILKPVLERHGYRKVSLGRKGRQIRVHQLVADAFLGEQPDNTEINHKDGNKSNNAASNLEYVTRLANVRHAIANGLQNNRGEQNGMAKFTDDQIRESYELVKSGASVKEASWRTGVTVVSIRKTIEGKRVGYDRII